MITVAKIHGKVVQIVKYADKVDFSSDRGWICYCTDFEQQYRRQQHFFWVSSTTMFEWVRTFYFESAE